MGLFEALLQPESIGVSTAAIGRLPIPAKHKWPVRLYCRAYLTLHQPARCQLAAKVVNEWASPLVPFTLLVLEVLISPPLSQPQALFIYTCPGSSCSPWRLGPSRAAAQWAQRRQINRRLPSLAVGKGQRPALAAESGAGLSASTLKDMLKLR